MKYKVIHSLDKINPDKFSLTGSSIKINGKEYDLVNPKVLPEIGRDEQDNPILESSENQRVYLDGDTCFIRLHVSFHKMFLFQDNNDLLYHDRDSSGGLDLSEFSELIHCLNIPNDERVKEHKAYEKSFIEDNGIDAWNKKRADCKNR